MGRTFKLVYDKKPKHKGVWVIKGLPDQDYVSDELDSEVQDVPDTELTLVGMYHSCDSPEDVMDAVYSAIYDHHQVTEGKYGLKDGDVIESEPTTTIRFNSWDSKAGKIKVPAMRFRVESFHVVREEV